MSEIQYEFGSGFWLLIDGLTPIGPFKDKEGAQYAKAGVEEAVARERKRCLSWMNTGMNGMYQTSTAIEEGLEQDE